MYHIVFNGDEKYIPYICVCIASIVENTDKSVCLQNAAQCLYAGEESATAAEQYCFHILTDAVSAETSEKLAKMEQELSKRFPTRISVHVLDDLLFVEFPRWRRSYAAYYRILLAHFLPQNAKRALYLDGDMLVNTDIRPFMLTDMQDCVLCAVPNYPQLRHVLQSKKGTVPYSFQEYSCYFNSGMMLIDLEKWKNEKAEEKIIAFLNSYHVLCPDQDALNAVFKDKVKILPYQWNLMWHNSISPAAVKNKWKEHPDSFAEKGFYENLDFPKIIHYSVKPWNSNGFRLDTDFNGFYYPNIDLWWETAKKVPVFSEELMRIRESAAYAKMLKTNVRTEKLLRYSWYRFLLRSKQKLRPYMRKAEQPFKKVRDRIRIARRKRT